jgi:DNA-binding IclR family transcriptional regulator
VQQNEHAESGVAAVDRALSLLAAFRPGEAALPLRELAARTGLYKSTILRLLASLERARCVERRPDASWALGPMLFFWGSLYRRGLGLEDHAPATLAALAQATGESASFWVREGSQRLCLFRAESDRPVRAHVQAGDLLALDRGASGRVLMGQGTSATFGERDPELAAIAAPVRGPGGELLGALSISGPRARIEAALETRRAAVKQAADALTRRLGGDLPWPRMGETPP